MHNVCHRPGMLIHTSGAEEHKPDGAEDQDRQPGRDGEEEKHGWPGLGLAGFSRGFDDPMILSRCHGALDSVAVAQTACPVLAASGIEQRMIPDDVPDCWASAM